jgi:aspartate-semialdehyde dehydrogenase
MSKERGYKVAVIGATGLVGGTFTMVLEERGFPVAEFLPVATRRSGDREIEAFGRAWRVEEADALEDTTVDVCFFTAGREVSLRHVPSRLETGSLVVDNTTAFRMKDDVPLVVPEVNGNVIGPETRLVSSPNCTTIILCMALAPLHRALKVKRVVLTSFQSVSGTGREALEEMLEQSRAAMSGRASEPRVYPKRIAFNCIPWIGGIEDGGFSGEENKIIDETRKILAAPSMQVVPTAVRVPVEVGHAMSVNIETQEDLPPAKLRDLLNEAPGVRYDDGIPTQLDAAGSDDVVVGRLRRDPFRERAYSFWVVGDNLRKGAATNSVQIAELLLERRNAKRP